jgi:putative oxidoreductase
MSAAKRLPDGNHLRMKKDFGGLPNNRLPWQKNEAQMKLEHPIIPLAGRLMITYIFATSGIGKVFSWSSNVQYMSTRHLPLIPVLLAIAAIVELGGSICLITGYQARIAAFIMFLYTTAVTVIFHNYWAATGMMAGMQETHFRKNLAIMGGLLILAYSGPGKWALGEANRRTEMG